MCHCRQIEQRQEHALLPGVVGNGIREVPVSRTIGLAEHVNDALCGEGLAHGLRVTNRVSPGYGAWDVTDQRRVFELCPGDAVGVVLNEACFMTPTKSISLMRSLGPSLMLNVTFTSFGPPATENGQAPLGLAGRASQTLDQENRRPQPAWIASK